MTTYTEISIQLSNSIVLDGSHPIVLLGPNGSGKTRLAIQLQRTNNAELVAALRNIALPEKVSMQAVEDADKNLKNTKSRRKHWELSSEIGQLFSKLLAEDSSSAIAFRDQFVAGTATGPSQTKLMTLSAAWGRMFPGREIDFSKHTPLITSDYANPSSPYLATQMSDGERVALYLAGRVLDAPPGIIIIDEPEVHFHSRLAARFWSELEQLREDCRFVYVTHDLPFARSRRNSQFVIVRPGNDPNVLSLGDSVPSDIVNSLLAAATFSIHAKRIVFCEGEEGRSIDQLLYQNWFNSQDTALIPVGSCKNVVECVRAFSESSIVEGVTASGLVDRDYWPDAYLNAISSSVTPLPYHEAENLFCLYSVFEAVAKHLGKTEDIQDLYDEAMQSARDAFHGGLLSKQISERFKRRCNHELTRALNAARIDADISQTRTNYVTALQPTNWNLEPGDIFDSERTRLETAIGGTTDEFLQYFPGKTIIAKFASVLGLSIDPYVEIVTKSLIAKPQEALFNVGQQVSTALAGVLPNRQ